MAAAAGELAARERLSEMTLRLDRQRSPRDLLPRIARVFELSAAKIRSIEDTWRPEDGAPVFTVEGPLSGARLDRVDAGLPVRLGAAAVRRRPATQRSSSSGASRTVERMAPHLTHMRRARSRLQQRQHLRQPLAARARAPDRRERLGAALLRAGAEGQRRRAGAPLDDAAGGGFIHSFNGAHSLFVDTIRSLRALALGRPARAAADGGAGRAASACSSGSCSTRGRPRRTTSTSAADAIASTSADASRTRACSTSPTAPIAGRARSRATRRSRTWTRGLAWAMLGFAEQIEFLETVAGRGARSLRRPGGRWTRCSSAPRARPAITTSTSPLPTACRTGTRARRASRALDGWRDRPADPFNDARAGGQLRRGHRQRRDCCAWARADARAVRGR